VVCEMTDENKHEFIEITIVIGCGIGIFLLWYFKIIPVIFL